LGSIQQSQIQEQKSQTSSLEQRIAYLEKELLVTQRLLKDTLHILENHVGKDIDRDEKIG